ncbi:hypothetical protein ACFVIM_16430 [Streptomyces sp. NPDC057638]|uniref:hypothetical protein n=1 Tax=Streptomyces sp. NPDC057638 TaxID=3346190 RepID=UPI0036CC4ADB
MQQRVVSSTTAQLQRLLPHGAVITGLAALALRHLSSAPSLPGFDRIDALLPGARRSRRREVVVTARGLAEAVGRIGDPAIVRKLLTAAVRNGHCEPSEVIAALSRARLLDRPGMAEAVDGVLAEGRARAERALYEVVRAEGLPEPFWDVELRVPGGPLVGRVDAYWEAQGVAVELDTRAPRRGAGEDEQWGRCARRRERMEALGITVVHMTPGKLREAPEQQAVVIRVALAASEDRPPVSPLVIAPG